MLLDSWKTLVIAQVLGATENAGDVGCPTSACVLGMVLQQSVCC